MHVGLTQRAFYRGEAEKGGDRQALRRMSSDVAGRSPVDLGDLGNRYALSYQSADARKLGARNLARRLRLGLDRGFDRLAPRRRRPFRDAL
jgi:hypothetical protein